MFVFLCLSCVPISSCQADEWETFACSVCSVNLISSQTNTEQVFVGMRQERIYGDGSGILCDQTPKNRLICYFAQVFAWI